jgi:hypothetical protein
MTEPLDAKYELFKEIGVPFSGMSDTEEHSEFPNDKYLVELDCRVSNPELWSKYIAMKKQSNKDFYVPDGWFASESYIKATFPELALDTK